MAGFSWRRSARQITPIFRASYSPLVALATASAFAYVVFVWALCNLTSIRPQSDVGYYFLRASTRVNDVLWVPLTNPISTDAVRRDEAHSGRIGEELVILLSVIAFGILVAVVLGAFRPV